MSDEIFVANESAVLFADGEQYVIHKNQTRVRAGHPLLKRNAHMFKPIDVDYDIEDTRNAPGQRRRGRRQEPPAGPPPGPEAPPLKGETLDAVLDLVGLAKTGTAEEKRARLAEHAASGDLKGETLDAVLDAAGLAKTGTAEEKRARLAEHAASGDE
jgi:hypothetical protein